MLTSLLTALQLWDSEIFDFEIFFGGGGGLGSCLRFIGGNLGGGSGLLFGIDPNHLAIIG